MLGFVIVGALVLALVVMLLTPLLPVLLVGLPLLAVFASARRCFRLGSYWIMGAVAILVLGGGARWGGLFPHVDLDFGTVHYAEAMLFSGPAWACLLAPWACIKASRVRHDAVKAASGVSWGLVALVAVHWLG